WAPCTAFLLLLPGLVICLGPVSTPHAAAGPRNLSWALDGLLMLLQVSECVMGPCTPHCCCLHRHTLACATFRYPHTADGVQFCHRVLFGLHCCCLHATL
ncbi:unnamed protein product, partial [Staurois parvus]